MNARRGILFCLLAQLCMVMDASAVHFAGVNGLQPSHALLLRALGTAALVFYIFAQHGGIRLMSRHPGLQALRAIFSVAGLWMIYYALANLELADAATLNQTRPIWMALLGVVWLGESLNLVRGMIVLLCFIGTLILMGPAFVGWDPVWLVALGGAFVNSIGSALSRHLNKEDPPEAALLMSMVVLFLGGAVMLPFGHMPWDGAWPSLPIAVIIAFAGALSTWFMLLAVRDAEVSALAGFDNWRLPFTILMAFIIFAEVPKWTTILGAALILLPGFWLYRHETGQGRQRQALATQGGAPLAMAPRPSG
jgi:drug/metabolite transporter (DMT)-like permease